MKTPYLLILLLLFIPSIALATEVQTYIEFKYISKDIQPGSFDDSIRKLWRSGKHYVRLEEAPDPEARIHGLMIINAPNSYLINLYTKSGRHVVDPGPSIDVHVPVFQGEKSKELAKLEMGHEIEFFQDRNATHLDDEIVDDIRCTVYQLHVEEYFIKLFLDSSKRKPYQVSIVTPTRQYIVKYIRYSTDEKFDNNLYLVPQGIILEKTN